MSTTLHRYIHSRLREVFGQPDHSMQRDDHWFLQPGKPAPSVSVLVNRLAVAPTIWVFDPAPAGECAMRLIVRDEPHVEEIIVAIRRRLEDANQSRVPALLTVDLCPLAPVAGR